MIKFFTPEGFPKAGKLVQLETGTVIYSKDDFRPLQPYHCPVCAKSLAYGDKNPIMRTGLCMTCNAWWEEKNMTMSKASFEEKSKKYYEWAKEQVKKNLGD